MYNTGNFYGGHICAACDYLRTALANISDLSDKQADLSSYSDAKIMTGLLIEDEEMIKKLGYTNYWQDQPASLVFGINVLSKDQDESKMIITAVLKSL